MTKEAVPVLFFPDLLKFCPFFNRAKQNVGYFSKKKGVYFWKYALGSIINTAYEQQELEIQEPICLQCGYNLDGGGVIPHSRAFSQRTRQGGCWVWSKSRTRCRDPGPSAKWLHLNSREMPCRGASLSPSSSTVVFTPRDARATMLLGHAGNAPESRGGSDAATPGALHHAVLYPWSWQ